MPRITYQAHSLPLQRELGRGALPSVRSNGPTVPPHISCISSIWKMLRFYSSFSLNPSKSIFFHALTLSLLLKNHMLFIISKTVHIDGHANRVGLNLILVIMNTNSDNDSFGSFLSKKKNTNRIFCSITV